MDASCWPPVSQGKAFICVIAGAKSGWHRSSQLLLLLHRNHHQRAEHTQRSERQRMRKHPDQDFRTDPGGVAV